MYKPSRFSIDWISSDRKDQLSEFRQRVFRSYYGDRVDTDRLTWNHNDDVFPSLGVFSEEGDLLSCLRLAPLPTPEEFFRIMLFDYRSGGGDSLCPLPVLSIGRSATDFRYARRGFHTGLRWVAMRLAINSGYDGVISTCARNDARLPMFQNMGARFVPYRENWSGFLPSSDPPVLAVFNGREAIAKAAGIIQEKIPSFVDSVYSESSSVLERANSRLPLPIAR